MGEINDVPVLLQGEEEQVSESSVLGIRPGADLGQQLEEFRERWRRELREESSQGPKEEESREEQARQYFQIGTQLEEKGALYEAIEFYKRAMQLVPDIETRIRIQPDRTPRERQESESSIDESFDLNDDVELDLIDRFHHLHTDVKTLCRPAFMQRACHISALPVEVIIYIFKWVVSKQLDMKSLENLSEVCRGFYLCARDEELWRLACVKVWGTNTAKVKKYGSWRKMFIERPHLQFVGCYISMMSYVRQGEKSLDSFYRPWHSVEYYRYARFFTEGFMIMMTSPEEPMQTIQKLKSHHNHVPGVLKGYYKVSGKQVTGILKRVKSAETGNYKYKRNRNKRPDFNESEQTFHVEFEIANAGKRNGSKLIWVRYAVRTFYKHSGEEYMEDFQLNDKNYPPMMFSRVKSFSVETGNPLQ